MTEQSGEKPKIIIDEDWKSRAEAEKAHAEQKAAPEKPSTEQTPEPAAEPAPQADSAPPKAAAQQLPPPTLPVLVSTLATQAMVFLGQIPNPLSGKSEVALSEAQHFIDTIAMLQEKTAGNRQPEEDRMFDMLLHELRMAYIHVSNAHASQSAE